MKEYTSNLSYEVKNKKAAECQHLMVEGYPELSRKEENPVHFRFSVYIFVQTNV